MRRCVHRQLSFGIPFLTMRYMLRSRVAKPGAAIKVETTFDYLQALKSACVRDDQEGEREAQERPEDLLSDPTLGLSEDQFPDFDIDSPLTTSSPSSSDADPFEAASSTSHSPPSVRPSAVSVDPQPSTSNEDSDSEDEDGFTGEVLVANPFSQPPFAAPTLDAPPTPSTTQPSGTPKRKRHTGHKIASNRRKDSKKKEAKKQRREEGYLPVHDDSFADRHLHPDLLTRDFDVYELKGVKGGDTGVNQPKKSRKKGPKSLKQAADEGFALLDWDGRCVALSASAPWPSVERV